MSSVHAFSSLHRQAPQTTICDMASNIGRLIKTDLREIWKNEEYDFSNWLAQEENLVQLSDEIGIPIRLLEKEAMCSPENEPA